MSLVDSVTYVMTPKEWGKPIDVDKSWIEFVDDNVKASEFLDRHHHIRV